MLRHDRYLPWITLPNGAFGTHRLRDGVQIARLDCSLIKKTAPKGPNRPKAVGKASFVSDFSLGILKQQDGMARKVSELSLCFLIVLLNVPLTSNFLTGNY